MENISPKGRGLHPLLSLNRHGRKSFTITLIIVLLAFPIIWIKGKSFYVAEAIFQIFPNYQKTMSADRELEFQSNSQYREYVNQLSQTVLRYGVISQAIERVKREGIEPCLPSENDRKCVERLQRTVYVLAINDTYMVRVGLKSSERKGLEKIVNAIMDTFLEVARDEQIYGSDKRIKTLVENSKILRAEITDFEDRRVKLAGFLGLTTFGENTANPYDAMRAQIREKLLLASIERSQAQATLDAFTAQLEPPASSGRSVLEMRLQDSGLQALRNEVVRRSLELGHAMNGLQALHPGYKPAADELVNINHQLDSKEKNFEKIAQENVRSRILASVMQTRQIEKDLREREEEIATQATAYATSFREAMRLTGNIHKREQDLDEIRTRLNFLTTESNAIGFVRLITPALPADTPQGIGKTRLLLILAAAGIALSILLPLVFDAIDRRILTVGDAEKALGITSATWLVDVNDEATRVLLREQLRRFASTLLRNHSRGARGVFGFSSVTVGGGTTTLILDVALTLKQLGSSVLLIDADSLTLDSLMRSKGMGLSELLAGYAKPYDIITQKHYKGEELFIVPFGQARESGIQRLDILKTAIEAWSQNYDIILVDIAPILPSADAELLIDAIGQVFLVVEADIVTKGQVNHARAQLEKLAPEAVGLVVNKVRLETGGRELQEQMIETITRRRFESFMTLSNLHLQFELLRIRWQQFKFWRRH